MLKLEYNGKRRETELEIAQRRKRANMGRGAS